MQYIIRIEFDPYSKWYLDKNYCLESTMLRRKPAKIYKSKSCARKNADALYTLYPNATVTVSKLMYEIRDYSKWGYIIDTKYADTMEEAEQIKVTQCTDNAEIVEGEMTIYTAPKSTKMRYR